MLLQWTVLSVMVITSQGVFCPYKECDCYFSSLHWVTDCRARDLNAMPTLIHSNFSLNPNDFNELLLSENNITEIPVGSLPAHLHSIISAHNPLTHIDDGALAGSRDTLTFLDIGGSDLTQLPDDLMEMQNLTSLSWADNPTVFWNTSILSHLGQTLTFLNLFNSNLTDAPLWLELFPFLQHLDLGENNLSSISIITNMTQLHVLDLAHNNISQLDFDNLPSSLQYLRLRDNNISNISAHVTNLVNLINLDISDNNIQSLDFLTFPSRLSELYASGNNIDHLFSLDFSQNASNLHTLYLNNNPLTDIQTDAFAQVPDLDRLVVSGTLLSRLPIALGDLAQIRVLELNTIPTLSCTCAEKPLALWYNVTSVAIFGHCHEGDVSYFLETLAPSCP